MMTFESEDTGIWEKIKDFWVYDVYASVRGAYYDVRDHIDKNGNEIDETRLPKVEAMTELIRQLNRDLDEELPFSPTEADNCGGYVKKYNEEYKRLRDERYEAIFRLIKGNQEIKGSGIENWWD